MIDKFIEVKDMLFLECEPELLVIAKHCPEGSIEWALWKMFNGKTISRTDE